MPVAHELVAIVELEVSEPRVLSLLAEHPGRGEGEGELVAHVRNGPLLREGVDPAPGLEAAKKLLDVLDDAELLVVGLFDQKAVVLDRARFGGGGGRLRPDGRRPGKDCEGEKHRRRALSLRKVPPMPPPRAIVPPLSVGAEAACRATG